MSAQKLGHLVIVEGNKGVGAAELIEGLRQRLQDQGYQVTCTQDLSLVYNNIVDPASVLMYCAAHRQELIASVIKPRLAEGEVVLCNGGFFGTFAKHVHMHKRDDLMMLFNALTNINHQTLGNEAPILVNLSMDETERRNRYVASIDEQDQSTEELDAIAEAYDMLASQPGALTYNAARNTNELADSVVKDLLLCFEQRVQAKAQAAVADELTELGEQLDAPQAEEQPTSAEPEMITLDVLNEKMLNEIEVHSTNLEQIYAKEFTQELMDEWTKCKDSLRAWVDLHIEEIRGQQASFTVEQAEQHLKQISANIGAMLGSWLTLMNIRDMVAARQSKEN